MDLPSAALDYASLGLHVIPLHSVTTSGCSCGKPDCPSPGKHPRIAKTNGHWGSSDPDQVARWWRKWPLANIGVETGWGLQVVDLDSSAQYRVFKEICNTIPETAIVRTGRGVHLWFTGDGPNYHVSKDILVRGRGGLVVAPPSRHASGHVYAWLNGGFVGLDALAPFPAISPPAIPENASAGLPGALPGHLKGHVSRLPGPVEWTAEEEARVRQAVESLDPDLPEGEWIKVLMALADLRWVRSDGSDAGEEIALTWSERGKKFRGIENFQAHWRSCGRPRANRVSLGTVFWMAEKAGWQEARPPAVPAIVAAEPFSPPQVSWPDGKRRGWPLPTFANARAAIAAVGLDCRHDVFHERLIVGGHAIGQWAGELSDPAVLVLRALIREWYGVDCGTAAVRDAAESLCFARPWDPVVEYLAGLQWDGTKRIATWLTTYLGAADCPLHRAMGELVLIAAVRRARKPGCKFDQILVLEGIQGTGKSSVWEILAGKENFSDQSILGHSDREQQEAFTGTWIHEIADLTGLRKADVERVKAFASRKVDRARPAYARYRRDQPRRGIATATTNEMRYLQDQTGNRRFWPVKCERVDLEGIARDRDQLWAEAAAREVEGVSIGLPESLWREAAEAQEERRAVDPWEPLVENWTNKQEDGFLITDVLQHAILMAPERMDKGHETRVGYILRRLGFEVRRMRGDGLRVRKYFRTIP